MKAVILYGALTEDTTMSSVYDILVAELETRAWQLESFILHDSPIAPCLGCFLCWVRTPGICVQDDGGQDIARAVARSDLVVFLTPVTFGGYSSELKKAVDHLIPNTSPFFVGVKGETHHQRRYKRYPRLIGIGVLPRADEENEHIFKTLVHRNAINMYAPAYAGGVVYSSQGTEQMRSQIQALLDKVDGMR
jgi:multimeric flavodoxin WrbA